MRNIYIFASATLISLILTIFGYLWAAPRYSQVIKPFFPKTSFSIDKAPEKSLTGLVGDISGNVAWLSRSSDLAKSISSQTPLQQGEEVDTLGDGYATIIFSKAVSITAAPDTQISFIQTLPVNFVVEQKQGTATYEKIKSVPVSIRSLYLLINIDSGICTISVDPDSKDINISNVSGQVTASFNDTDNLTNILTVSAGERYSFNNDTKVGELSN